MKTATPLRLAMWSGPRNISTAMMRAWGNRPDTAVIDEPLYAYYLQATSADHPGAEEVIVTGETDWRSVVTHLTREVPDQCAIYYQKQMTHHLLPEIDRSWLLRLTNCFLIRDPAEVIASYTKKNHDPSLAEIGLVQQSEIFDFVREQTGVTPSVIDARDVLENPRSTLLRLCGAVGVEFSESMLSWPAGPRGTDGIWAKHWYAEVERSTSFRAPEARPGSEFDRSGAVFAAAWPIYERLRSYRLQ